MSETMNTDSPIFDGTDAAHPAWWRGNDAGVAGAVMRIREVLDGTYDGRGVLGGADLEQLRRDVAALTSERDRLAAETAALKKVAWAIVIHQEQNDRYGVLDRDQEAAWFEDVALEAKQALAGPEVQS